MEPIPFLPVSCLINQSLLFFILPKALKLLLEQEEDVTRVQDGLYIDRADWKECSSELETIIEGNNPSFVAREMLRALGSGRRPVHPRDITVSTTTTTPREKHRFDAVVKRVQGCVFPELQSLLTQRMACPQFTVTTQTDGSPMGHGDKTVALTTVSHGLINQPYDHLSLSWKLPCLILTPPLLSQQHYYPPPNEFPPFHLHVCSNANIR